MKKNYFMSIVLFVALFGIISISAQEKQIKPNKTYKIYTYTVVGSNDSGNKSSLPQNLQSEFNKIRGNFGYSNYELLSMQFQLIKEKGSIEYKSILKDFEPADVSELPVFSEWTYRGFGENSIEGRKVGSFKTFQFGIRFPVKYSSMKSEGKSSVVTNYERIGLISRNMDFVVGQPVLFATLPIEKIDKTLFFFIHLRESN